MRTIAYGIAGEGFGHSMRALGIVPELLKKNKIIFLVGGKSKEIIYSEYFGHPNVEIIDIPVPLFYYNKKGKLKLIRTIFDFLYNWKKRKRTSESLLEKLSNVDIFISDYEPITSWIAKKLKKPLMVLNSQNLFNHVKPVGFIPLIYILRFWAIRATVLYFGAYHKKAIVSHYEDNCFNKNLDKLKVVGPILRKEIKERKRFPENFVLVYIYPSVEHIVLPALERTKKRFVIYGLGERKAYNNLIFKKLDKEEFLDNLFKCSKVICTAGTTLTSECLYLGIPFLVVPMPNQFEQKINSILLEKKGIPVVDRKINNRKIEWFVEEEYGNVFPSIKDGSKEAIEEIERFLAENGCKTPVRYAYSH